MEKTALLLMAYGGPDSLADVEPYLLDVRGGRPTSPELVQEITARYAAIGGRSPLLEITRRQASALADELNARHREQGFEPFVGMRHWQPRIRQAVEQMHALGASRIIAMVMAPHYSRMSIEKYLGQLDLAVQDAGWDVPVVAIRAWHDHPGLIAAIVEKAREKLEAFAPAQPYVLFTAHSLPSRILAEGDPYVAQLHSTAALAAAGLGLAPGRWQFCFQSAGRTHEPWLGPQIEEVFTRLASQGVKDLLVVPVGFVADHVEVLFDIDIEARHLAQANGIHLERSDSLNASPIFITALADIVGEHLKQADTLGA